MNCRAPHRGAARRARGFTLIELMLVVTSIAILAALLLPALRHGFSRAQQTRCASNLRQVGLGFIQFAHEHAEQFPMMLPVASGGAWPLSPASIIPGGVAARDIRSFQAISRMIEIPRLLVCPADDRQVGYDFASLRATNLSYFVGIWATPKNPNSILSGDENLVAPAVTNATYGAPLGWSEKRHGGRGNLLFADGRVLGLTSPSMKLAFQNTMPPPVPTRTGTAIAARPAPGGQNNSGEPTASPMSRSTARPDDSNAAPAATTGTTVSSQVSTLRRADDVRSGSNPKSSNVEAAQGPVVFAVPEPGAAESVPVEEDDDGLSVVQSVLLGVYGAGWLWLVAVLLYYLARRLRKARERRLQADLAAGSSDAD